jgi:vancomycin resistance protein YoaR
MKSSSKKNVKETKVKDTQEVVVIQKGKKRHVKNATRTAFWFLIGAFITLFLISSFSYLAFQGYYKGKIYPGVTISGIDFSKKTESEVRNYFADRNLRSSDGNFVFSYDEKVATISAKDLEFGYDENLLATQAISIGRSKDPLSNISTIIQAYTNGVNLSPAYKYSDKKLNEKLEPFYNEINKQPVEAVFNFENGRVTEFKSSENGREVDKEKLATQIVERGKTLSITDQKAVEVPIPVKIVKPNLTTDKVNEMGIKELIGTGTSTFKGSIENRIFNLSLAASKLNGVLVKPGEVFSFNKTIGDVSSLTGYKQAYVIQNGRTVLGDGGGVCQVSTTFFRALLNAGLPIIERNQHAYRVSYYEQDSPPGIDAAIYTPNIDLRFKNDTGHHILIQTVLDPAEQRLTFMLYGTSDGRVAEMTTPVITNQTPAPEPKYEDDPNLPVGTVKQVDFAAPGARTYFTRTVTRDGKVISQDSFTSNYRPWQAVFLRGTKPL